MARNDNRLYAQFTLDYADSHKIAPLSDAAFRAHVRMVLWSRRMMTDGKIPGAMAAVFAKPKVLSELTGNDEESPSLVKVGNDYFLHHFLEHQTSRADIEAQTKRNADNGRRGGQARAKRVASEALSDSVAKSNTETETETETTTSKEVVKEKPASRGSRLSPDWLPSEASRAKAAADAPNVDHRAEHATFVDYWIAQPGQKGVKTDWEATWRNWMRRKEGDVATRRPAAGERLTKTEKNLSVVARYRAMEEQQEQRGIER